MTRLLGTTKLRGCLWPILGPALFALLGLVPAAQAQLAPDWAAGLPTAAAAAVALDRDNNSLVTGWTAGAPLQLSKFSPAGALLWQRSLTTLGAASRSLGLVTDAAGNSIVSGFVVDAAGVPQAAVVAKVDAAGRLRWQDVTAGRFNIAWRAAADTAGHVYALSRLTRPDTGTAVVTDMVLTKFSPAGARLWTRTYGAAFADEGALIVTSTGQVVVAGGATGGAVLAAFDAAGTALWTRSWPGFNSLALAAGRTGEFYAVGGAGQGFQVLKFDAARNLLWSNAYPARGPAQQARVDSAGNLVVTGSVDTNTGLATVVLSDWLTIKLGPDGALLWSNTFGLPNGINDVPLALALGADDAVYVTGQGTVLVTDGGGAVLPRGSTATVKYTPDGAQAWVAYGPLATRGVDVKASTDGGVVVVAESPPTLLRYPQSGLPNQAPMALASASATGGQAPLTVAFSAAGSSDADGRIAAYAWDFGDGQASSAANPTHTYAAGTWSAQLTVTDNLGTRSTAAPLIVNASALSPARLRSLDVLAVSVTEGGRTTGTITVSNASGVTLLLSSSNAGAAAVPAQLVIPPGSMRGSFTVTTGAVRGDTRVTIRARANGSSASDVLTVRNR
jgi:PKD repeat protein